MSVDPGFWSISHAFSCTFLVTLATLVTYLGPRLGGGIVGPREPKAQLGELDTNCDLSSFLKDIVKITDVDIDSFSNHDKMYTQPDETGEIFPLNPGGGEVMGGGTTWEPECEQETLFGGKTS